MKIPKNLSEEEVLRVIENVVGRLSYKFVFGYHDVDDIKQQGRLYALQGLKYYDNKRPLENFLWTHVRNRLFNYKRDNYMRPSCPCTTCPHHYCDKLTCILYDDILECLTYNKWYTKNNSKKNIMTPIEFSQVQGEESNMIEEDRVLHNMIIKDMISAIDNNLPMCLRSDYLRLKDGAVISKNRKDQIRNAIKQILIEEGYWEDD